MDESLYLFLLCLTIPITIAAAFIGCRFLFVVIASYFHVWNTSETIVARSEVKLLQDIATVEAQLMALGFQFVQIKAIFLRGETETNYEIHYIHPNHTVLGVIVPIDVTDKIKFLVSFYSVFEDKAMIITRYPFGSRIFSHRLISTFSDESISSAFEFHTQQVTAWELSRQALRLYNRADIERLDYLYKTHHKRRDHASGYINLVSQGGLLLVTAIAGVGVSFAAVNNDTQVMMWGSIVGGTAFFLMVYLSATGLNKHESFENRRRKSGKTKH